MEKAEALDIAQWAGGYLQAVLEEHEDGWESMQNDAKFIDALRMVDVLRKATDSRREQTARATQNEWAVIERIKAWPGDYRSLCCDYVDGAVEWLNYENGVREETLVKECRLPLLKFCTHRRGKFKPDLHIDFWDFKETVHPTPLQRVRPMVKYLETQGFDFQQSARGLARCWGYDALVYLKEQGLLSTDSGVYFRKRVKEMVGAVDVSEPFGWGSVTDVGEAKAPPEQEEEAFEPSFAACQCVELMRFIFEQCTPLHPVIRVEAWGAANEQFRDSDEVIRLFVKHGQDPNELLQPKFIHHNLAVNQRFTVVERSVHNRTHLRVLLELGGKTSFETLTRKGLHFPVESAVILFDHGERISDWATACSVVNTIALRHLPRVEDHWKPFLRYLATIKDPLSETVSALDTALHHAPAPAIQMLMDLLELGAKPTQLVLDDLKLRPVDEVVILLPLVKERVTPDLAKELLQRGFDANARGFALIEALRDQVPDKVGWNQQKAQEYESHRGIVKKWHASALVPFKINPHGPWSS